MNSVLQKLNGLKEQAHIYQEMVAINHQIKGDKNYKTIVLKALLSDLPSVYTILKKCTDVDSQQEFILFLYKVLPAAIVKKHRIFGRLQDEFLKITAETFDWSSKDFMVLFNADEGQLLCSKIVRLWFQDKEVAIEDAGFIFFNPKDIKVNAGKQVFKVKYESVMLFSLKKDFLDLRIKNNNNLRVQLDSQWRYQVRDHLLLQGIKMDPDDAVDEMVAVPKTMSGTPQNKLVQSGLGDSWLDDTLKKRQKKQESGKISGGVDDYSMEEDKEQTKRSKAEKKKSKSGCQVTDCVVNDNSGMLSKRSGHKKSVESEYQAFLEVSEEYNDEEKWKCEEMECSVEMPASEVKRGIEESGLRTPETVKKKKNKNAISTPFNDLCLSFEVPLENIRRTLEITNNITISVESDFPNPRKSHGGCVNEGEAHSVADASKSTLSSSSKSSSRRCPVPNMETMSQSSVSARSTRKKRKRITFTPKKTSTKLKGSSRGRKASKVSNSSSLSLSSYCDLEDPFLSKPIAPLAGAKKNSRDRDAENKLFSGNSVHVEGVSSSLLDRGESTFNKFSMKSNSSGDILSSMNTPACMRNGYNTHGSNIKSYAEKILSEKMELIERIKNKLIEREKRKISKVMKQLERFERYKVKL